REDPSRALSSLARGYCKHFMECLEGTDYLTRWADAESCAQDLRSHGYGLGRDDFVGCQGENDVAVPADELNACLTALGSAPCAPLWPGYSLPISVRMGFVPEACAPLSERLVAVTDQRNGRLALGSPCTYSGQCGLDAECSAERGGCGECRPRP